MQLKELYLTGKNLLDEASIEQPGIEARALLADAAGLEKIKIFSEPDMGVKRPAVEKFNEYIRRRSGGEPFAYITGQKEFYSRAFNVNRHVLIPRPETELVVETALGIIPDDGEYVLADIGSGSGCIGVTICSIKKNVKAILGDISLPAIKTAKQNSTINNTGSATQLFNSAYIDFIKENSLDMVLSNPPYVRRDDYQALEPGVRNFEPPLALLAGEDGLIHIREIIIQSSSVLKQGGWLVVEIGTGQSNDALKLFEDAGFSNIKVKRDLNGIERVISGQWKNY